MRISVWPTSVTSRNFVCCKLTLGWVDSADLRTCTVVRNRPLEEVDASLCGVGILFSLIEQLFRLFQIFQLRFQVCGDCFQFFPLKFGSGSQRREMVPT